MRCPNCGHGLSRRDEVVQKAEELADWLRSDPDNAVLLRHSMPEECRALAGLLAVA